MISPLRAKRLGILAGIIASVALIYYFFNPAQSELAPKCFIHALTGYDCPGCGSQRMLHALMHADLKAAWNANPFLLIISPLLLFWVWIDADPSTYPKVSRFLNSTAFIIVVFICIIAWTVLRNIMGL